MPHPAHHPVVALRRRHPVLLSVGETRPGDSHPLPISAGPRVIGSVAVPPGCGGAARALLSRPAWLLLVAAELHADVIGRVWALIPAGGAGAAGTVLGDGDAVFAVPLLELQVPRTGRSHPGDLVAEVRRLLAGLDREPEVPAG